LTNLLQDKNKLGHKEHRKEKYQRRKLKSTVRLTWIRNCKMAVDGF
jgi:hypothetical protein